jgi:threonine dehydratase
LAIFSFLFLLSEKSIPRTTTKDLHKKKDKKLATIMTVTTATTAAIPTMASSAEANAATATASGSSLLSSSTNHHQYCIDFSHVEAAAARIQGLVHRTPVLTCASINRLAGPPNRHVFFKVEALQRTGSFKFRGAVNAIQSVLQQQQQQQQQQQEQQQVQQEGNDDDDDSNLYTNRNKPLLHVVTHSSGNHAQALALAAKLSSTPECPVSATIVMPHNTPLVKKAAVQDFGAKIVLVANTNEARENEAERIRIATKATFVHPSEDARVIAGQGTVCLELVQQLQEQEPTPFNEESTKLDLVIIPVGGGGLAAGNIITLRHLYGHRDDVKIVLAEPSVLDDAKRSFDGKTLLQHAPDNTLDSVADGLKTTLGPNTWPIVRDLCDDIFTVSEREILQATKLIWERLKICIEPSAGVGVAVLLYNTEFQQAYPAERYKNVGIVLCGGNVDVLLIAEKMKAMGL